MKRSIADAQQLAATFDFVLILDALPQTDRDALRTSQMLTDFLRMHRVESKLAQCRDSRHVLRYLRLFANMARSGERFLLHIVSHGTEGGLWLEASMERLAWSELTEPLSAINSAMNDAFVVNITSCFGASGIDIVDPEVTSDPFFGLIGSSREIDGAEAISINSEFYRSLIASEDVPSAVAAVNQAMQEEVIFARPAVELRRDAERAKRGGA